MDRSSSSVSMWFLILFPLFTLLFHFSHSKTILVDGLAEWRNPYVCVGDTIIFKHKHHYNLYIFQSRRAFKLCNFTQATLLTNPTSNSYMWHPSRPGFFYFSFNNGTLKSCDESEEKLPIKVSLTPSEGSVVSPQAAPSPESGRVVSSSPAYHQPLLPPQANSPSPFPTSAIAPATVPPILPDTGGGIPFINSNPAVPLPTGETDAATIRPLPVSASGYGPQVVVGMGMVAVKIPLWCVLWMMLY